MSAFGKTHLTSLRVLCLTCQPQRNTNLMICVSTTVLGTPAAGTWRQRVGQRHCWRIIERSYNVSALSSGRFVWAGDLGLFNVHTMIMIGGITAIRIAFIGISRISQGSLCGFESGDFDGLIIYDVIKCSENVS